MTMQKVGDGQNLYLVRVPKTRLMSQDAYEYYSSTDPAAPTWSGETADAKPIFTDSSSGINFNGVPTMSHNSHVGSGRFLLTAFHGKHGGQLGVFDAPKPWGPWTTAHYVEDWLGLGPRCDYPLIVGFPQKWSDPNNTHMWSVFSVWARNSGCTGDGENYTDRFNLMKVSITTAPGAPGRVR